MKYNVGDIVLVKTHVVHCYAYVSYIGTNSLGMNWYTLKYQTPQKFGSAISEYTIFNERDISKYVEKVE
jgi:hypothetical protein